MDKLLNAPEALDLDHRSDFRQEAVRLVDGLPEGQGRIVIDLTETRTVDSAGLGALIAVQRHAAERHVAVQLRGASEEIRILLVMTKLAELFEVDGARA